LDNGNADNIHRRKIAFARGALHNRLGFIFDLNGQDYADRLRQFVTRNGRNIGNALLQPFPSIAS
jgi:hypothetical protein